MITVSQCNKAREKAARMIEAAGFKLSLHEIESMDVADFGLGHLEVEGAQIVALADTECISIRLIALTPNQTEPEHWHTAIADGKSGKEETVRILTGTVRFYIPGPGNIKEGFIPPGKEQWYTCRHEVIMKPGDQLILKPGTRHWFQAAEEGAVMVCFCSSVVDTCDLFTDSSIIRETKVVDDCLE